MRFNRSLTPLTKPEPPFPSPNSSYNLKAARKKELHYSPNEGPRYFKSCWFLSMLGYILLVLPSVAVLPFNLKECRRSSYPAKMLQPAKTATFWTTVLGGVPTTPDPSTSAKASRYKWEEHRDTNLVVYILISAKRRAYFRKSIAIEMGGVSRYFSRVSGSGVDVILLRFSVAKHVLLCSPYSAAKMESAAVHSNDSSNQYHPDAILPEQVLIFFFVLLPWRIFPSLCRPTPF